MWRLETAHGSWHTAQLQFHLDLTQPDRGWTRLQVGGEPLTDSLFQIHLPGAGGSQAVIDSYVRQADLVVTYAQSPDRSVRPQLVWRVLRDGEVRVGVELILSMQTSLLESEPEVQFAHRLGGQLLRVDSDTADVCEGPARWDSPAILLQRPPQTEQWSMATIVHPTDFQTLSLERDEPNAWQVRCALFPQSLEKGVIRRGRVRGIFVPRAEDVDYARQCHAELTEAAPPLTT